MRVEDLSEVDRAVLTRKRERDATVWNAVDNRSNALVTLGERCYLARRRAGVKLTDAARAMGISHRTLIKRERNNGMVEDVARYWGLEV